ncbi:MAG: aldehyde dehydrogenase family protein, partial [Deltaproteobacteria bacterium]|nr:aldehyde dehydrogenase family protein [Deltaproteobacteria bacterium]
MRKQWKILINGEFVETSEVLEVINPYNNEVFTKTFLAEKAELEAALEGSTKAFEALKKMPAYVRARLLRLVATGIEDRAEEFAEAICLEAGKPITDARVEVARAVVTFSIAA